MRKSIYIILAIVAIVGMSFIGHAQTDSTGTPTQTVNTVSQINHEIESSVLPLVLKFLAGILHINLSPFMTILIAVIMWFIRFVEKRVMKDKFIDHINTIVNERSPGGAAIPEHHENKFKQLIKHLRGEH